MATLGPPPPQKGGQRTGPPRASWCPWLLVLSRQDGGSDANLSWRSQSLRRRLRVLPRPGLESERPGGGATDA